MVTIVQSVRASDCGSECRGFESHLPPKINPARFISCRVSCYISVLSGILFLSYKRITIVLLKVYYRLKQYKKLSAKGRKYPSSRHSYKDELKTYLITFTSPSLAILTMLEG